ncbi:MAG: YncE family protein [Bryobacteraceae bacterium]
MISRRALLAIPLAAAGCRSRRPAAFQGYAMVANSEGNNLAAVDLEVFAVARHIPLDGAPAQVLAAVERPSVYALTPDNGSVHEIEFDRLAFKRKLAIASSAVSMHLDEKRGVLYVLARDPKALARVDLDSFRVDWRIALPEEPLEFALAPDGKIAAVSSASGVRLIDLASKKCGGPLGSGDFGQVRFLSDSRTMIAANRGGRMLSFYETTGGRLIADLPVAVRPDHLCFNLGDEYSTDGGQLFVTGDGMDAVVVVYPYYTPEIAGTVLAGHAPGAMAASSSFLFIASPQAGETSILEIRTRQVIAVVSVGSEPDFICVTPDDQYALVLNRKSGDMSVLRVGSIQPNRSKMASLLTVVPVGSGPVSAAVKSV